MKTKIYALQDENGKIRYIGKTGINLSRRFGQHLSEARHGRLNHRCNWIRSLLARGIVPAIIEIGECEGNGCKEEIAWIKYFKEEGVRLANMTDGGEGLVGIVLTKEAIIKRSMAHKGHIVSTATRRRISMMLKGRPQPIDVVLKRSIALKGHICSEATRQKIKLANTGKKCSAKSRLKISMANKGHPSPMKGRHHSEASNQKNRLAHVGKVQSLKTRLKIGASNKTAWAKIKAQKQ